MRRNKELTSVTNMAKIELDKVPFVKNIAFFIPRLPGKKEYVFGKISIFVDDKNLTETSCIYEFTCNGVTGTLAVNRYSGKAKVLEFTCNSFTAAKKAKQIEKMLFIIVAHWGTELYRSYQKTGPKNPNSKRIHEAKAVGNPKTVNVKPGPIPINNVNELVIAANPQRPKRYKVPAWWSKGYIDRWGNNIQGHVKHRREKLLKNSGD